MRRFILIYILATFNGLLFAQELPNFIRESVDFCDHNLTEKQTEQFRKELNELEEYFVMEGLLKDKSGLSYQAVYEQIVKEEDLNFEIKTSFLLLDSLEFRVYASCFYKVLTPHQLAQITDRHLEAARKIGEVDGGNISPALISQGILENLTLEDFDLEYYRVSSLLAFYRLAHPTPKLSVGLQDFINNQQQSSIEITEIILNEKNEILIANSVLKPGEAERLIYDCLKEETFTKGIEISPSREASYESYLKLLEIVNSTYSKLKEEYSQQKFGKSYAEISTAQQKGLDKLIPKNIIFREPK